MSLIRGDGFSLIRGDCRSVLSKFRENRFDSVVSDPPYGLEFMQAAWDSFSQPQAFQAWCLEWARELLRVLKPGAFALMFGGTRTYHRMTCALEDAGFEIRDSLHWFYGTGFPKSLNLGEGRGTALKPGHEPIVLAMKPLEGTFAKNLAQHGTGALNIDACRIPTNGRLLVEKLGDLPSRNVFGDGLNGSRAAGETTQGRWPANVLLDEASAAELDAQSGKTGARAPVRGIEPSDASTSLVTNRRARVPGAFHEDEGGASRFFYVAKPRRAERDLGCESLPAKSGGEATMRTDDSAGVQNPRAGANRGGGARNFHPTVKPVALMRYLVRLATPPGGSVLDPFTGSGTTGMGARLEGRGFLGVEQSAEFLEIARLRIEAAARPPINDEGKAA